MANDISPSAYYAVGPAYIEPSGLSRLTGGLVHCTESYLIQGKRSSTAGPVSWTNDAVAADGAAVDGHPVQFDYSVYRRPPTTL